MSLQTTSTPSGQPRTAWGTEENESALNDSSTDGNSDDGWVLVDRQVDEENEDDTHDVDSEMYEDAGSKWKRAWEAEYGRPEDETDGNSTEHSLGRVEDDDEEEEESSVDKSTRDWSSSSEEVELSTENFADSEDVSLFSGIQPESWKSSLPMKQRVRGLGPL